MLFCFKGFWCGIRKKNGLVVLRCSSGKIRVFQEMKRVYLEFRNMYQWWITEFALGALWPKKRGKWENDEIFSKRKTE